MKKTFFPILLALAAGAGAQSLNQQVVNSAGSDRIAGGFWLSDNVGEAIVETFAPSTSSLMLTQGFLQPDYDGVIMEGEGITVYNAVTPNGDGRNDRWFIGNIGAYPDNKVSVYSRWGEKVFETRGYSNESNFWPPQGEEANLHSTTYFYIIELGNQSKPLKGWVELIKN